MSLAATLLESLGISATVLPSDLTLQPEDQELKEESLRVKSKRLTEVESSKKQLKTKESLTTECKVLTGQKKYDHVEWENELAHLTKRYLTERSSASSLLSEAELSAVAANLPSRIEDVHTVDKAVLLGLLLSKVPNSPLLKLPNFDKIIQANVLEKYPMNNYRQVAGEKLLEQLEGAVNLEVEKVSFEFPPFQRALPFFPSFGYQVTLFFKSGVLTSHLQKMLMRLLQKLKVKCDAFNTSQVIHADFNVGFEPNTWETWCKLLNLPIAHPIKEAIELVKPTTNSLLQHSKLRYDSGHVWFFLKGDEKDFCEQLRNVIKDFHAKHNRECDIKTTEAYKKNEGKLFGGSFLDGISSAVDAMSIMREIVLTDITEPRGAIDCDGGTFAFTQFFRFDQHIFLESSDPQKEIMIGRNSEGEMLPRLDDRSHVKKARLVSRVDGTSFELLRQALPFEPLKGRIGPVSRGLFFVAFGKSFDVFFKLLNNMLGDPKEPFVHDLLLTHVQGEFGQLFYCPSAHELNLPCLTSDHMYPAIPFWLTYKSDNPLLFYNHVQYLHAMTTNQYRDPPSKHVLYLLSATFARWHSTWQHKFDVPRLPHLKDVLSEGEQDILTQPIQIRKGYSYKKMLGQVLTDDSPNGYGLSDKCGTYRISPKELIVGVLERLSLASGKEVMPYLLEKEKNFAWDLGLAEGGNMGHIVPGHQTILKKGVAGMLQELHNKLKQKHLTEDQKLFYQSAIYAYEGVQLYLLKFALLALRKALQMNPLTTAVVDRSNMRDIAKRMFHLAVGDPRTFTFHDAVQMIFSMHCCLHLVGQIVSVGRLDQLLISFYKRDIQKGILTPERAQDIIEAFFIKFDENVVLNRYNIPTGHTTYGTTCVVGAGGATPFPTGDSLNQWIQQVTLGGYLPDDNRCGTDGCNEITLMCLKACRRLPLNSPCVSLRLTPTTPTEVRQEAARALLSGGAHPILFNDDKMVNGLHEVLRQSFKKSHLKCPSDLLSVARDYACDGCYEPMFQGSSEFKFAYIFTLRAIIFTLNAGADYQPAGPLWLAGGVKSYRTPLTKDIDTFKKFTDIFLIHLRRLVENLFGLILGVYGRPWQICPSPLLSCLLEGCMESGRDLTNGGSRFHIITPMFTGFANVVNCLYNVKQMVYSENTVTTLEVLRMALINNWGENMVEPFYDDTGEGIIHTDMWAERFKDLRQYALGLPKFGTTSADEEVNELAGWLADQMNTISYEVLYEGPLGEKYKELMKNYNVPGKPFVWQMMTGTGTFESYVNVGSGCAATPDGRLGGQPTASDCSPQPFPQDFPVPTVEPMDIIDTLKPYDEKKLSSYFPNGCEVDITIKEDFPEEKLVEFIDAFTEGKTGPNLVTVTCVNPETFARAEREPQKFDLIRNRMGGWTNFFISMFPEHQKQHRRRPLFGPHKEKHDH